MPTLTKAGRYELREELGRGAMGVVYRAHDPVIGRDVAVKTLHLSEAGTGMSREELVGRFQTEARAAGLLTHPNIVIVHDAGEEEGVFYITMELVEGRSLQTLIDGHQLFPLPRVMRLMEQACTALDFAHQRNVIHRDVKPANLMLTADDTLKITDFGTAKILQFGTAQTAHVMGTPSYMSPEQVKGKPVDGRSDIFALGVILYELMTGEKPFPGQNITTVIYKIINEDPIPPRSIDSSIHQGLSSVITRALAKDPSARFQNCHELLDALKNYRNMVDPIATARINSPLNSQVNYLLNGSAAAHVSPAGATPPRTHAETSGARPRTVEPPVPHVASIPGLEEEISKKGGTLALTLILLAIIGFTGYRVWPPMLDLWQRLHAPAETPTDTVQKVATAPAASTDMPTAKPDFLPLLGAPSSKTASEAPAENPAPRSTPAPAAVPDGNIANSPPARKPPALVAAPAANLMKATLEAELAGTPLAEKVSVQITGSTLALSGRLTPREHGELLTHLRNVPAGVRVIDDIGYADESK